MGSQLDSRHKKFTPLKAKTLKNALVHRLREDFPRLGGPRILDLCAEMILEVVHDHLRPQDHLTHGQLLWLAVSINDPPRRQRIADTDLIPVVLDLSDNEDIDRWLERAPRGERHLHKALRLCRQAHQQGGLLSNCDLAEILNLSDTRISALLASHEKQTQQVVPRRATLHDVGTALTHKRIICHKRYAEGKQAHQIARETRHSLEAVDRYLGQFDRVRHCRLQGLSPADTAFALGCSLSLIHEYLVIDGELEELENG